MEALNSSLLDDRWETVIKSAKEVSRAYSELLAASDALADAIGYNRDWILGRVWPKCAHERRRHKRVFEWIKSEEELWKKSMAAQIGHELIQQKRATILKRLNLSDDEKFVLGLRDIE